MTRLPHNSVVVVLFSAATFLFCGAAHRYCSGFTLLIHRHHNGRTRNKGSVSLTGRKLSSRSNWVTNATSSKTKRRSKTKIRHSTTAYEEVRTRLDHCRTTQDIDEWVEACVDASVHWNLSPREETDFVRALGKRRAYKTILLFVRKVARPTSYIYTAAMSILGSSTTKKWKREAIRLFEEEILLKNDVITPTSYTLAALFRSVDGGAAEVQRWRQRLGTTYPSALWTVEVYNAAIGACMSNRDDDVRKNDDASLSWQTALQLHLDMKRQRTTPNSETFAHLLRVCAKAGQVRIALSLLEEALQNASFINQNTDLGRVFSAALYACSLSGDYRESLSILQGMHRHNQTVNTYHVSSLLTCLAKQGKEEEAIRILFDGMLAGQEIELEHGNNLSVILQPVAPDLVAINIVLDACAKSRNYHSARMLLERLKSGDILDASTKKPLAPDVISYNAVLAACADPAEARAIVKEMRDSRRHRRGVVPPTSISYTHAITACRKADPPDVKTALAFLDMARHDGIESNVFMYSAAIWTAERAKGGHETALSLLEEMRSAGCQPNVVSYNGAISALAVCGRGKEATQLWEEMKELGLHHNKVTFQRLASAIRHSNETRVAKVNMLEQVLDKMHPVELQTKLGGAIIETAIRLYGSQSCFDDAMRVFYMIEGPADSYCLRAVLYACGQATPPRWEEALSILHTSDIVEGCKGPARVDPKSLSYAILACCKADQWEEALNLAELYARPSKFGSEGALVSMAAFNALIAACGRAGQPSVALRLLSDMNQLFGISPDERTYRKAVIACNQAEHDKRRRLLRDDWYPDEDEDPNGFEWWECALSLLRRMKEEGLQPDPQTYSSVISACEAAGQWQRALGVLQSMMNEKGQEAKKNELLNLYCFNAAISACEKGGAWVEATELYYRMLDAGGVVMPNFVTLNSLLVALDKAGQKELSQSTYEDGVRNRIVSPWKITRGPGKSPLRALDLHRFSAAMTSAAIRSVIESLLEDRNPEHDATTDLIIIVGKGKGSEHKPILLPTVQRVLQEEYDMKGHQDPLNAGRLIVASETLQEFRERKRWR